MTLVGVVARDPSNPLLHTLPGVPEMGEKTLRWPGHIEAIQPLVADGTMVVRVHPRAAGVARVRFEVPPVVETATNIAFRS